ncbi:MAG: tRNA 2-thiouridine(34) synthase MnmA [Candidatus Aminicenantes bacterium]|nr:tRNA 2-thiouridine(34) synthase MnmA [Candidatus Aminicenantes bacterium]
MKQRRVVVAMSGGVDSSVAAALLKEEGYDVIGVTMKLFSLSKDHCRSENLRSCCGWKATEDAHRVAISLGISHYVVDFRDKFEKSVIADFSEEYSKGSTPNPCIRCNQYIKFDFLMKKLGTFEADYLATGHHARVEYDNQSGRYLLKKGKDKKKDQSYFLYPLTQKQLSRTLMPIGNFTKEKVRKKAQKLGLSVAQRHESQEICFIPDNDYVRFLRQRIPEAFHSGPIVDIENRVLGQHEGIAHFTIGQRKGIGIAAPQPLYVVSIQSDKNTIVIGPSDQLYKKTLLASQVNLISKAKITKPLEVRAKIRYKHTEAKAFLTPQDTDKILVEFEKPQRAITPGQSVVFYEKDVVVGGGIIDKSE